MNEKKKHQTHILSRFRLYFLLDIDLGALAIDRLAVLIDHAIVLVHRIDVHLSQPVHPLTLLPVRFKLLDGMIQPGVQRRIIVEHL